ncbi:MAG: TonB-dependent receptor, partial [Undibacterium sp.]|nr:TonB-dependent receptor [Undibacterium sp.]
YSTKNSCERLGLMGWFHLILKRKYSSLTRNRARTPIMRILVLLELAALPLRAHAAPQDISTVTGTVTVTAKKELVVKKIDKTVYNIADTPRAANGTAQDVLQSTPEVSVSADGQIAVKGNTNVTVLIDGKPTAMMSGEGQAVALQTMSGADIASVEVMTNPSAAYNANGGAILNIVLKRNRKPGAHAQIQGSAADQGLWNAGTSADMTAKDISVHGSLAYRRDGTLKFRESAVDWRNPLSAQSVQTFQTSEVFVRRTVESASLGIDYSLSDADSVSLSGRYNDRYSRPWFDVFDVNRNGNSERIYHRISNGPNEQSDHSATLSYSHQGNGTAFKTMVQDSDTVGLIDKSYRDVFVQPILATDYSHGVTRSARHLKQSTVDWTRSFEHGQWGLGLDFQDKADDIYNYQASVDSITGLETPTAETTNNYAVETRIAAAYLTYMLKEDKWQVLLGGRAERLELDVHPVSHGIARDRWTALNPSLNLRYAYSNELDLTLNYRRSLQMPDSRDLNPFSTYIDAQNLSQGNPALRPQRLNSWEVGANFDAQHIDASLGAFYRNSVDTVIDARTFIDQVLVTSKQNGGQASSIGATGSLDWRPDASLQLGIDLGVYQVTLDTPDLDRLRHEVGVSGYLNLRAKYSVGSDDISLDAHGRSSGITPLGQYGATSNVNLTWRRQFSKTLSLTINANDIFDGSKRNYSTHTSTFHQNGFDHFVARRVYVGFVKKFN